MMRYIWLLIVLLAFVGCGKKGSEQEQVSGITVTTSNFALYDFVRSVGGERISAELLLPAGVEAHSYEPTPKDMVKVKKSTLFVCLDREVEPWIESMVKGVNLSESKIVEAGAGVEFLFHSPKDEEEDEHHGHDCDSHKKEVQKHDCSAEGKDPHIWLDPVRAQTMVWNIAGALMEADSSSADYFSMRRDSVIAELQMLHERFDSTLADVDSRTIMYAGHFAFGYFTNRYNLEHISPYTGFSPNSEPTPAKIAHLIEEVKKRGISTIYYEELVEPRVARIIREETGVDMVILHGIHNVSSNEMAGNFSYLKGMEENRLKLEKGLNSARN